MLFYFHIHDGANVVCSHLFVFYVAHHHSLTKYLFLSTLDFYFIFF
jgi:hypothetical protein